MGGFRFNGCGATDRFYEIKKLGYFECPHCGKYAEFSIDEVKRKVDVFWIPTVTWSVKYAVMCKHCENGRYISMEEKDGLLNGTVQVQIDKANGINLLSDHAQPFYAQTPANTNQSFSVNPKQIEPQTTNEVRFCPHCGKKLVAGAQFCSFCGTSISAFLQS